jgi:hypothetical protein
VRLLTGEAPPSGRNTPEIGEISVLKGLRFHLTGEIYLCPLLKLSFGHDP